MECESQASFRQGLGGMQREIQEPLAPDPRPRSRRILAAGTAGVSLTGAGVQRLGPDQERRAHRVQRKFLEVVAGLLGEDLVDHEGLVAPPACLGPAGRGQPQRGLRAGLGLGVAVHGGTPAGRPEPRPALMGARLPEPSHHCPRRWGRAAPPPPRYIKPPISISPIAPRPF